MSQSGFRWATPSARDRRGRCAGTDAPRRFRSIPRCTRLASPEHSRSPPAVSKRNVRRGLAASAIPPDRPPARTLLRARIARTSPRAATRALPAARTMRYVEVERRARISCRVRRSDPRGHPFRVRFIRARDSLETWTGRLAHYRSHRNDEHRRGAVRGGDALRRPAPGERPLPAPSYWSRVPLWPDGGRPPLPGRPGRRRAAVRHGRRVFEPLAARRVVGLRASPRCAPTRKPIARAARGPPARAQPRRVAFSPTAESPRPSLRARGRDRRDPSMRSSSPARVPQAAWMSLPPE